MEVYRITRAIYTAQLVASGGSARWNTRGRFVIYTAGSRALACLENVVHRSGEGLQDLFRVMVINVPDTLPVETITLVDLPPDWSDYQNYDICQALGESWLRRGATPVMRVPSAIVPQEWNYLLNPAHPLFADIRLLRTEAFAFDPRLKA
ncbi:RES family NAD+ phosphorylase [Fibrella forsythiae]|uniref:RES family NAD+ phosphorylase n=1 Tax=Fibrella forsythiae TaxID=2817061 RepID=A0ABS3JBL7_9BACT|nr:RES family NAD+ phosphorylase [Fibrella forsythiae]MBO0947379.1 RES family NAD+ phosphorylase [Fibrella forsythiae]